MNSLVREPLQDDHTTSRITVCWETDSLVSRGRGIGWLNSQGSNIRNGREILFEIAPTATRFFIPIEKMRG